MNSLNKVFAIIELLKKNGELRLQDIADNLGLHKSTAHRLVSELCALNYLDKRSETKRYRLGLKFLDISSTIIGNLDIREQARQSIEELNALAQETIHLAMLLGNQVIYIDKKESPHSIRMYSQIGRGAPLYCTALGKVILAFQAPEIQKKLLDSITFSKCTDNTITSREELMRELDAIRKKDYATDNEEHEKNIGCIAAPIRDYTKRVVAAISITAILYRLGMKDLMKYKDILIEKCHEVSKKLGYKENHKEKNG